MHIFFLRCKGLVLLETYSSLDGERLMNCLPKFLNIVKETTGDPSFSMFNLSLKEDWSKTKKFCHSLHGKGNSSLHDNEQSHSYNNTFNNIKQYVNDISTNNQ